MASKGWFRRHYPTAGMGVPDQLLRLEKSAISCIVFRHFLIFSFPRSGVGMHKVSLRKAESLEASPQLLIRTKNILHFNLMNYAQIPVLSFPRKRESSLFYQMWN